MRIARSELSKEENKPTGMIKRESKRSGDRVFPMMEERKSTRISLMNPIIREEGSSQIRSDQEFFN